MIFAIESTQLGWGVVDVKNEEWYIPPERGYTHNECRLIVSHLEHGYEKARDDFELLAQEQVIPPTVEEQARSLLDIALEITSGDRRRDYGRPLINHVRIAIAWTNFLGFLITPDKVVWMMILLKGAREANTPKGDNLVDVVGYSLCLDDMYDEFVEMGYAENKEEAIEQMSVMPSYAMQGLLVELQNKNLT